MFAFAMLMSLCADVVCVGRQFYWCPWCWIDRCVYVEECGTPFLNWCCVDVLFLNVVYAFRLLM